MAKNTINPGSPPLVWSSIDQAFEKINNNFTELYLTIEGDGGTPVDLENLASNITPDSSGVRDLGSPSRRWRDLYLSGSTVNLGGAVISSPDGSIVALPAGSTVGGQLIRNPLESSFKTIAVGGQDNVVANDFTGTVNFAGTGINITTNATSDTVTFVNAGVTQLAGTTGQIGVSAGTGSITLTNLGVTKLNGTPGEVGVSGNTGEITLTNLGATKVFASTGITVSGTGGSSGSGWTGAITIANSLPDSPSWRNFDVTTAAGILAARVEADQIGDTVRFISGRGISITTDAVVDSITFNVLKSLDINGSVFGDDSSLIVDATSGKIYGTFYGDVVGASVSATTLRTDATKIALGNGAGGTLQGIQAVAIGAGAGGSSQGQTAVAIGVGAGGTSQGQNAVAIGNNAGISSQGQTAIAIGYSAGSTNQAARTIILNATGSVVDGVALQTDSFYVAPIRNATGTSGIVQYDATTKEVSYSSALGSVSGTFTGNIFTTLIDSADSSAITVTPKTIFSSDIQAENDLTVSNGITFSDGSVLKSYSPVTMLAATTTAQTIPNAASASPIQFVDTVDTANAYSGGVFTAPYTGYYQWNISIYFSTTVTLNSGSFFQIGNLTDSSKTVIAMADSWTGSYFHYSTVVEATAGDTIAFVIRQVSGATIDVSSGSRLTIHRVSIGE